MSESREVYIGRGLLVLTDGAGEDVYLGGGYYAVDGWLVFVGNYDGRYTEVRFLGPYGDHEAIEFYYSYRDAAPARIPLPRPTRAATTLRAPDDAGDVSIVNSVGYRTATGGISACTFGEPCSCRSRRHCRAIGRTVRP